MMFKWKFSVISWVVIFLLSIGMIFVFKELLKAPDYTIDDPDDAIILYHNSTLEELKQIHEKYPDDKVLLANYVASYFKKYFDENMSAEEAKKLFEVLKYGEKLDEDNALYNFYLAALYFQQSVKYVGHKNQKSDKEITYGDVYRLDYEVTNEEKFDLGVKAYLNGCDKDYFNPYTGELAIKRVNIQFDSIDNIYDVIQRISIDAATLLPHLNHFREVARLIAVRAQKAYLEGDSELTEKLHKSYPKYIKAINSPTNYTLIEGLVSLAICAIYADECKNYYAEIGNQSEADKFTNLYKELENIKKVLRNTPSYMDKYTKSAGYLATMLLPCIGEHITEQELVDTLRNDRMIWYKMSEKITIATLLIPFIIVAVVILIAAIIAKIQLKKEPDLYLELSKKWLCKIILFTYIAPLMLFLIINFIPCLSGRNFSLQNNLFQFCGQMFMLSILATFGAIVASQYLVNQKEGVKYKFTYISSGIIFAFSIICSVFPHSNFKNSKLFDDDITISKNVILTSVSAIIIIALIIYIGPYIWETIFRKRLRHRLFILYILPFFIFYNFLNIVILFSLFSIQERYYFEQDKFLFNRDLNTFYITKIEQIATQKIQTAIDEKFNGELKK